MSEEAKRADDGPVCAECGLRACEMQGIPPLLVNLGVLCGACGKWYIKRFVDAPELDDDADIPTPLCAWDVAGSSLGGEEPVRRCFTCRFFESKTGDGGKQTGAFNSCHAHPPGNGTWWAITQPEDWCGEWEERK